MAGVAFLALAKAKNIVKGYSSPKPFDISNTKACIDYDIRTVDHWLRHLQRYTQEPSYLSGKSVLELGPGSDLGTGLYLLSKGCSQYNACDVNDLMSATPNTFYKQLFEELKQLNSQVDIAILGSHLERARAGLPSRLSYIVRDDFNLSSALGKATMDLIFSQAAFEHFDDIHATVAQISAVCKPGAVLLAEIDLKTHSRWIRERDPNNIYRYSRRVYDAFWFRGIPNRVRPFEYEEALERAGWTDISILPLTMLDDADGREPGIHKDFTDSKNKMTYLSIMLCAKKE